jgi:hypothetical protein
MRPLIASTFLARSVEILWAKPAIGRVSGAEVAQNYIAV